MRYLLVYLSVMAICANADSAVRSVSLIDSERSIYCVNRERTAGLHQHLSILRNGSYTKTRAKRWKRKFSELSESLNTRAKKAARNGNTTKAVSLSSQSEIEQAKVGAIDTCFAGGGLELSQDACNVLGDSGGSFRSSSPIFLPIIHGAVCQWGDSPIMRLSILGRRCTGSLFQVDEGGYWVATAAHCFSGLNLSVGDVKVIHSSGVYANSGLSIHPNFIANNKPLALFDLAVVRFDSLYTERVIPLAFNAKSLRSERVSIAGFGIYGDRNGSLGSFDSHLRAAQSHVSRVTDIFISFPYSEEDYSRGFGNTCNGDSGGPLVHCSDESFESCKTYGVLSNGRQEKCGVVDVSRYTNLSLEGNRDFVEAVLH